MPWKPEKPCRHPGCPKLTGNVYCKEHEAIHQGERANAGERGYDSRWRKARKQYLTANPLCVNCRKKHRLVKATVVDHIVPHRGDQKLFWDRSNWQPLCKKCHDTKTMTDDRYQEYRF